MPERLLLVGDDPLLDSVRFSLERAGYEVRTSATQAEALKQARAAPPDLAILDIGLPDGDGLKLCRALQLHRSVPVISLTAHDREMDVTGEWDSRWSRGWSLPGLTKPSIVPSRAPANYWPGCEASPMLAANWLAPRIASDTGTL
jgi:CheY-like chemotaxis protein